MANELKRYLSQSETELPPQRNIEDAVGEILHLHEAYGGSTFNLYFGDQAGQRLYSVSLFPDRSYVVEGREISHEEIEAFIQANSDLLTDPRCCVGTWYSEETDQTYVDISITLPVKRDAVALGKRYNQVGMFDLSRMEYIPLSGSGDPPDRMPPVVERLPELRRGRRKRL